MNNIINGFVASTAFRNAVMALSGWLALKLGLDPTTGSVTISGVLLGLVSLGMALWGVWESTRNKAVVDGKMTPLSKMTPADADKVATIVNTTPK